MPFLEEENEPLEYESRSYVVSEYQYGEWALFILMTDFTTIIEHIYAYQLWISFYPFTFWSASDFLLAPHTC